MDEDETNEKRQERMEGSVEADTGSVEARPVAAWQPATDRHTHTHTHTHTDTDTDTERRYEGLNAFDK